jgi:hypothetical protein
VHVRIRESDDIWDGLLDDAQAECVAVLRGYVDASTRLDDDTTPNEGLLTVAVYLFESGRVRRFRQEWRDTFGESNFSWADLISRQRQFSHLFDLKDKKNKAEHDRLVAAGVALVRDYIIGGAMASIWLQDVHNFGPTYIKGFGHAYSVAGHMAMAGMGDWAKRNRYRGGIQYVIEAGDDGYDQLAHLLSYAPKSKEVVDLYQWNGHSTLPKTSCSPFHAPDLFAWEWGKYWIETVVQKKRRIRMSLVNLLNGRLDSYKVMHLGGDPLLRFFNHVNDLGVQQLQEDRAAAASVIAEDLTALVDPSEQTERGGDHH